MKKLLLLLPVLLLCLYSRAIPSDTLKFYFELNVDALSKPLLKKLDSLVYNDIANTNTSILIIGYADFLGSEEHNKGLSERRAKSIQQYFISMNIPESNIKLCIGKGEIDRNIKLPKGYSADRRVDVVVRSIQSQSKKPVKQKSLKIVPVNKSAIATTVKDIPLNDLKVGQAIRLEKIFFIMGRHIVTDESYPELDKLFETMDENQNLKIQIEGHICCLKHGFDAEDEDTRIRDLSVARARYIYDYLVKKGIEKDRMRYKGFGRSMPLVSPERSPADEDKNRRVEIRVIEK
jgi:outer membrane protein OmpA-like peptidoglycan-associated protein